MEQPRFVDNALLISCYFFITLEYFLIIYYHALAKYPHEDSITKFLPTLLPVVFIGFCTWIAKNIIFKVIDFDKKNQISHNNENLQNSSNETPKNNNNESHMRAKLKIQLKIIKTHLYSLATSQQIQEEPVDR